MVCVFKSLFVPTAKNKWPEPYSSSKPGNQKVANGLISNTNSEEKHEPEVGSRSGLRYSELEIEKLACSLEALMSQNNSFSREVESSIEPDLSRCASCRLHQNLGRVTNNPGGEEVLKDNLILEDRKIIALLASEIKVPEDLLQKIEIQDTGQKGEKEMCSWECKSDDDKLEKFGAVKRVNSASLVEHPPKKEDWKNNRCNSDVAWSPSTYMQNQGLSKSWKGSKNFNRGNSRIRLISSSNSLNVSLPRLTSHHSSSDEEWFEEVEEGDDDVLGMNDDEDESEKGVMDVCPEYCGDKGAVAKSVKPATESISRTNLFLGEKTIAAVNKIFGEVPSNTTSCVEMNIKADEKSENVSLTGKSYDGVLRLDESKIKQKHSPKAVTSQTERESKSGFKVNRSKPLSILKRLTEGRKDSQSQESQSKTLANSTNRESFETLIVDPTVSNSENKSAEKQKTEAEPDKKLDKSGSSPQKFSTQKIQQIGDVKPSNEPSVMDMNISTESWETIELGGKKSKEKGKVTIEKTIINNYQKEGVKKNKCVEDGETTCCCILQ